MFLALGQPLPVPLLKAPPLPAARPGRVPGPRPRDSFGGEAPARPGSSAEAAGAQPVQCLRAARPDRPASLLQGLQ